MKREKEREDMLQERLGRKRGRRSKEVVIEEERNEGGKGGVKRQINGQRVNPCRQKDDVQGPLVLTAGKPVAMEAGSRIGTSQPYPFHLGLCHPSVSRYSLPLCQWGFWEKQRENTDESALEGRSLMPRKHQSLEQVLSLYHNPETSDYPASLGSSKTAATSSSCLTFPKAIPPFPPQTPGLLLFNSHYLSINSVELGT